MVSYWEFIDRTLLAKTWLFILIDMVWRGKPPIEVHVQVPVVPDSSDCGPVSVGCVGVAVKWESFVILTLHCCLRKKVYELSKTLVKE